MQKALGANLLVKGWWIGCVVLRKVYLLQGPLRAGKFCVFIQIMKAANSAAEEKASTVCKKQQQKHSTQLLKPAKTSNKYQWLADTTQQCTSHQHCLPAHLSSSGLVKIISLQISKVL